MSMPGMYVSPEQVMQDRADYARKGIARGRSLVALEYSGGIALVAENASATLRKVSEIYDRIAFAGVGKFSEFDQLRKVGVRYADMKGYQYSRDDVRGRALANAYSQAMGDVFTRELKPLEVEVIVAEVGDPTLDPETSLGLEVMLRKRAGRVRGELNLFVNRYDDYIYEMPTGEFRSAEEHEDGEDEEDGDGR